MVAQNLNGFHVGMFSFSLNYANLLKYFTLSRMSTTEEQVRNLRFTELNFSEMDSFLNFDLYTIQPAKLAM